MAEETRERDFSLISGQSEAEVPDRNVAMELVRVTEYGALAAARWIGRGEKELADKAAVDAMRLALTNVSMDGVVVIGEGEKDEAPMLYNGEQIGDGSPPQVDIAVDPLEGTELTAKGFPNALTVIALSERGTMFNPGPAVYMEKMATSPSLAHVLDMDKPLGQIVKDIAKERSCDIGDVLVIMLDRPRHEEQVKEIREAGARIRFILHGDVAGLDPRRAGGLAGRPAVGHRRHARGRHLGVRDQVPRRPDPRAPVAAHRRGEAGDHGLRARDRRRAGPRPPRGR